ncbi:YciI family protein [Kribbella sp. NPDC051586]|uniref:YciI family protein n=1 Tax=Kribbella sp. NPDC051586 TaxID=3364118 RepID=UPI0037B296C1
MQFLVRGVDSAEFRQADHEIHGDHQDYMDNWSAQLVARGPTLSSDGIVHTGCIHVLDVDHLRTAQDFAFQEPYAISGWLSSVSVTPLIECLEGTMWDRPAPKREHASALLRVDWAPTPLGDVDIDRLRLAYSNADGQPWLFGGVLTDEDRTHASGAIAAVDLDPTDAERQFAQILALTPASTTRETHRWRRGGRHA